MPIRVISIITWGSLPAVFQLLLRITLMASPKLLEKLARYLHVCYRGPHLIVPLLAWLSSQNATPKNYNSLRPTIQDACCTIQYHLPSIDSFFNAWATNTGRIFFYSTNLTANERDNSCVGTGTNTYTGVGRAVKLPEKVNAQNRYRSISISLEKR